LIDGVIIDNKTTDNIMKSISQRYRFDIGHIKQNDLFYGKLY